MFEHPAHLLCLAFVETLETNVDFDAQLELWAGKTLAIVARPQAPFRALSPGRHRISVSLDTEQLPDQLYLVQLKVSFLDANGQGKEMAWDRCDLLVKGRANKDLRRRRFEARWPPAQIGEPFLTLDLDWQDQALADNDLAMREGSLP